MNLLERWANASVLAKRVTIFFGAVAAVSGAITATAKAWPLIEPYMIAHRGYVIEHVGSTDAKVNELLKYQAEDKKDKILAERSSWAIQKQKESDPATQGLIQQRLDQLDQEEHRINQRIQTLSK